MRCHQLPNSDEGWDSLAIEFKATAIFAETNKCGYVIGVRKVGDLFEATLNGSPAEVRCLRELECMLKGFIVVQHKAGCNLVAMGR